MKRIDFVMRSEDLFFDLKSSGTVRGLFSGRFRIGDDLHFTVQVSYSSSRSDWGIAAEVNKLKPAN